MAEANGIAVIGMACIFPGAGEVAAFWRNICDGVDATTAPPEARLDPVFHEVGSHRIDRFACWRGGFIDAHARFDPYAHGFMPMTVDYAEPEQLLALEVGSRALVDAGYGPSAAPPARTAVVLGRGNYASSARSRFEHAIRGAEQLVSALRDLFPELGPDRLDEIRARFQARLSPPEHEAVVNLVPNLAAARIAERFNLSGPAYTVDAACASSLLAVDQACAALHAGAADLALAGGVHLCHSEDFWGVFNQLGLLSASGTSRPLDARADGLLIGEGVGFVVLKRAKDAAKHGDAVYATILGSGTSSDGRGTSVVRPSSSGQCEALRRAWEASAHDPSELELIEAHATGTQIGDAVEVATLTNFFGARREHPVSVGSVKSMIGHAMPAAGMAGLIKSVLAIHQRVLPPTLHCEQPRPELQECGFLARRSAAHWESTRPIAAVNAFGFGGVNAHVVLGASPPTAARRTARTSYPAQSSEPLVARYAAETHAQLLERVRTDARGGAGPVRALLLDPSAARRESLSKRIGEQRIIHNQQSMYFSTRGLLRSGGIACLFPGFEAEPPASVDDVAAWLGQPPLPRVEQASLEAQGRAVLAANRTLYRALLQAGVSCEMFAGHSVGEWNAMEAAGICEERELSALAEALQPGAVGGDDRAFIAVGGAAEVVAALIADDDQAELSHDNCPHQSVIACHRDRVPALLAQFASQGLLAQCLPFGSGVHSRFFGPHLQRSLAALSALSLRAPTRPVYSASTARLFPTDTSAIRDVIVRHLLEPVSFRQLIHRMYADGARVFIEAGSGRLTSFVSDTLHGEPHLALRSCVRQQAGRLSLLHVICSLWVEGASVDWPRLQGLCREAAEPRPPHLLRLAVPLVHLDPMPRGTLSWSECAPSKDAAEPAVATGLLGMSQANLARIASAQAQLLAAVAGSAEHARARPELSQRSERHRLCTATHPELLDHAFYRQPPGWQDVRDRGPVVPITGLMDILAATATEGQHGLVVELHDIWAKRWLNVGQPVDVQIRRVPRDQGACDLSIDEYVQARACVSSEYPPSPTYARFELRNARPSPIRASQLYDERWMFHGPAYQSVVHIEELAEDGISGTIAAKAGRGSLLDGAGQLLGLWLMLSAREDRLAMPTRIARVRYFGAAPALDVPLHCSIRIRELSRSKLVADIRVGSHGRTWAAIDGWEDRRFPTDDRLWRMIRWPERTLLCDVEGDRVSIPAARYTSSNTYDMLLGQYSTHAERQQLAATEPGKRWSALLQLVAAKDAVRWRLRSSGIDSCYPVELYVQRTSRDAGVVSHQQQRDFCVRFDHPEPGIFACVAS